MIVKHYLAVADQAPDSHGWSVRFPSFPCLTAAAAEFRDVAREASAALARALEELGDRPLPEAVEDGGPGPDDYPLVGFHRARCFLVPVATSEAGPEQAHPKEVGGPQGPEPTRYGDWERKGRCADF